MKIKEDNEDKRELKNRKKYRSVQCIIINNGNIHRCEAIHNDLARQQRLPAGH